MPISGGAFEQAYNVQATNDKKEVEPTLRQLRILAPVFGKAGGLQGDTGYYSEANVIAVDEEQLTPYIAIKRDAHNTAFSTRS